MDVSFFVGVGSLLTLAVIAAIIHRSYNPRLHCPKCGSTEWVRHSEWSKCGSCGFSDFDFQG